MQYHINKEIMYSIFSGNSQKDYKKMLLKFIEVKKKYNSIDVKNESLFFNKEVYNHEENNKNMMLKLETLKYDIIFELNRLNSKYMINFDNLFIIKCINNLKSRKIMEIFHDENEKNKIKNSIIKLTNMITRMLNLENFIIQDLSDIIETLLFKTKNICHNKIIDKICKIINKIMIKNKIISYEENDEKMMIMNIYYNNENSEKYLSLHDIKNNDIECIIDNMKKNNDNKKMILYNELLLSIILYKKIENNVLEHLNVLYLINEIIELYVNTNVKLKQKISYYLKSIIFEIKKNILNVLYFTNFDSKYIAINDVNIFETLIRETYNNNYMILYDMSCSYNYYENNEKYKQNEEQIDRIIKKLLNGEYRNIYL